jgi:hypothetical protein
MARLPPRAQGAVANTGAGVGLPLSMAPGSVGGRHARHWQSAFARLLGGRRRSSARPPRCCVASARVEAGLRTGGCLCGAVRYSVRGDPLHVVRCHCANCRKESGSAFTVYAWWPVEAFEITGAISSYDGRGFCPRCGSRLLDTTHADTHIEIRIGSLDDAPFELRPEHEVWVKRRESWIPPVEGAAQHHEN